MMKTHHVALIRETDCIGCTKCLDACPTDAIIGSLNQMHTVIQNDCTGCKLCITPCPMDCIELVPAENISRDVAHYRRLSQRKKNRMAMLDEHTKLKHDNADQPPSNVALNTLQNKKAFIAEALARTKAKKQH